MRMTKVERYYFGKVSFGVESYPDVLAAINWIRSKDTPIVVGHSIEADGKATLPIAFMENVNGMVPKGCSLGEIQKIFKGCEFEASKLAPCVENANDLRAAESIEACLDNIQPLRLSDIKPTLTIGRKALNSFDGFIGLDEQIGLLKSIAATVKAYGRESLESLHMLFTGNPGTGKSSLAEAFGSFAKSSGIVSGPVRQVSAENLLGKYAGTTPSIVRGEFERARGGILFIDEAYRLAPRSDHDNPYGYEAINAITELMERGREEVIVVCAGYTDEMDMFLQANPGLGDRFGFRVEFSDYQPEELARIFTAMAEGRGFSLDDSAEPRLLEACNEMANGKAFANARSARKLLDHTIIEMATRFDGRKDICGKAIRAAYERSGLGRPCGSLIGFTV